MSTRPSPPHPALSARCTACGLATCGEAGQLYYDCVESEAACRTPQELHDVIDAIHEAHHVWANTCFGARFVALQVKLREQAGPALARPRLGRVLIFPHPPARPSPRPR